MDYWLYDPKYESLKIQVMFTLAPPFIVVHVRWHDVQLWIKIINICACMYVCMYLGIILFFFFIICCFLSLLKIPQPNKNKIQ